MRLTHQSTPSIHATEGRLKGATRQSVVCVYELSWRQRDGSVGGGDEMDVLGLCVWCVYVQPPQSNTSPPFYISRCGVDGDKEISAISDAAAVVSEPDVLS